MVFENFAVENLVDTKGGVMGKETLPGLQLVTGRMPGRCVGAVLLLSASAFLFFVFCFVVFLPPPLSCFWTFCTENPDIWALFIKPRWDCDSQAWKGRLMFKETIQRIYFLLKTS